MKKGLRCGAALLLTAALLAFAPGLFRQSAEEQTAKELLVVWMREGESDVATWLKKAAAAYEKETGQRVYLRYASEDERKLTGDDQPDALIPAQDGTVLAYRGWALIVPDETAPAATPAPAPSLFIRPTLSPADPVSTPAPLARQPEKAAVPEAFLQTVEKAYFSQTPLSDLTAGKADGALLTPAQVMQVKGGYSIQARGEYFLPVKGKAVTAAGQAFLRFLRTDDMQYALAGRKLFSWNPELTLYGSESELLFQMENCRKQKEN